MMGQMRKGALSSVFIAFLLLGGVSIVMTDWTGSFRGGVANHDVAKIGGDRISAAAFSRLAQRQLRQTQLDPAQAFQVGMIRNILNNELWARQMSLAAAGYGLALGDEALLSHLRSMVEGAQKDDKTPPSLLLRRFIESQGMDEASFLALLRREILNNLLRDALVSGTEAISPLLLADLAAYGAETRDFEVLILPDSALDISAPDEATLSAYYEAAKDSYMLPERRTFRMARLSKSALEAKAAVTPEAIAAFYEENKDTLIQPERRVLAMAVFDLAQEKQAQAFVAALKTGDDLVKAAKAIKSKPAVTASAQPFAREGLLPELATAAFDSAEGTLVGPVKTAMGWHVFRVTKIMPEGPLSLAEATPKIRSQLESDSLDSAVDGVMDALDQAYEARAPFDDVVKTHGMSVTAFTGLTREGKAADGSDAMKEFAATKAPLLESAFSLQPGDLSPPIELSNGDIAILSLDTVTPAAAKPLADIRKELEGKWIAEQRQQKNLTAAGALLADLKDGKTTLTALAKEKGLTISSTFKARREAKDLPAGLSRAAWMNLFSAQVGTPVFQPVENGVMLAVVGAVHLPDASAKPEADILAQQTADLKKAQTDETLIQYLGFLGKRYPAQINERLLEQMYAKKDAGEDAAP